MTDSIIEDDCDAGDNISNDPSRNLLSLNPSMSFYRAKRESSRRLRQERLDTNLYALKTIQCKKGSLLLELQNEVEILRHLDHPHIVRVLETYSFQKQLFVVLELMRGGDLFSRDPYTEEEAWTITKSVLSAVAYMHSKGIIHRDLKYENIMFVDTEDGSIHVKIIDFGLSKKFVPLDPLTETVGTIYTMAPEVFADNKAYGLKVDIWALGVLAFMMLSSTMPFHGKTRAEFLDRIKSGSFEFRGRRWETTISTTARDFCSSLLVLDVPSRPSARDAMQHPWLLTRPASSEHGSGGITRSVSSLLDEMDAIQESLLAFAKFSTLKKLALMVVANRSTVHEIGFLRKLFEQFDSNHNGDVEEPEFAHALSVYRYSPQEIRMLFQGVDVDGTGQIHYIEFLAATLGALGPIGEERLAEAFDRIDCDDSGYISVDDCKLQ